MIGPSTGGRYPTPDGPAAAGATGRAATRMTTRLRTGITTEATTKCDRGRPMARSSRTTDDRPRARRDSGWVAIRGREAGPQVDHGLRVHLADPALGDGQHGADLGQRETLVVVEGEHGALALG